MKTYWNIDIFNEIANLNDNELGIKLKIKFNIDFNENGFLIIRNYEIFEQNFVNIDTEKIASVKDSLIGYLCDELSFLYFQDI